MEVSTKLLSTLILAAVFSSAGATAASAAAPAIADQAVVNVTATSATLVAQVNPRGLLTKYKLQIDVTGNFKFPQNDSCALHPPGILCEQVILPGEPQPAGLIQPPEGTLAPEDAVQVVSVNLASIGSQLQPATTYYYRAIAANSNGFAHGPTRTFTTPSSGTLATAPPAIVSQAVSGVTATGATLSAEIDPGGLPTTYQMQIDATGTFDPDQPVGLIQSPESSLVSPFGTQFVSVDLGAVNSTLQPSTTYFYRAVARNDEDVAYGPTETFTTLELPEIPPPEEEPSPEYEFEASVPSGSAVTTTPTSSSSSPVAAPKGRISGSLHRCQRRHKVGKHRARRACLKAARQVRAPR